MSRRRSPDDVPTVTEALPPTPEELANARRLRRENCEACGGTGQCGECDGTGECPDCRGGMNDDEQCDACATSEQCIDCEGTGDCPDCELRYSRFA